jgi:tetratricopeptide (TPR) repeat protein
LGHWQRSLEVSERLLTANPESAEAARDVSVILEKLAVLLARRGQPGDAEQALVYGQRGLEISEWQLIASPESAEAARDVSMSLETLAVLIARRAKPGDSEQALDHLQRGLEIRERLLTANPESAQAARDVFRSHFRLSELHRQRGDEQAAKDSFAKCFAILDDFVKRGRPMDAEMRDLHSQLQPLFSKP